MTVYISPNPGKISASEVALRAAQILQNHGASVLMCEDLRTVCNAAGVVYLPLEQCLERADVILTIGGDGTILHEANLSLEHAKPILGINLAAAVFWLPARSARWKASCLPWRGASSSWTTGCCSTPMFWAMTLGRPCTERRCRDKRPPAAGH